MPARSSVSSWGNPTMLGDATRRLLKQQVLVGVPGDVPPRQPTPGTTGTPPTNAVIGYVMEFGDDEKGIPSRPFLVPGVDSARPAIIAALGKAGAGLLEGNAAAVDAGFAEVGATAVAAVKAKMQAGPFAPLSERTIKSRAERRYADSGKLVGSKSSRDARDFLKLRAQGTPDDILHGAGLAQPLLDTRSLFTSITYVVRDKS